MKMMHKSREIMEYVDLVNKEDKVLGVTDKDTAHKEDLIHRVAAVYVFNSEGKLFVQEHKRDGRLDHSVGGHVRQGETYRDAAERETLEELGLKATLTEVDTFYVDETARGNNFRHRFGLFTCTTPSEWHFVPTEEVKVLIPMTIEEILKEMEINPEKFTLGFMATIQEFQRWQKR